MRLLFGALLLAACLALPRRPESLPVLAALLGSVLAATRLPARFVGWAVGFALLFYAPLVAILALPLLAAGGGALEVAGWILARGVAALIVSLATVATLRRGEWHGAIAGLPLPAAVRLLLLQIVHQTGLMLQETGRIRATLAVRGGGRGAGSSLRVMRALPAVWLSRVARRADGVAAAMEMRGYVAGALLVERREPGAPDRAALVGGALALAGALALHLA